MIGVKELREELEQRGLSPRKALGQNFLIDGNLVRKLVDASSVEEGDVVLEVGPGAGALTEELLDRGCRVIACELDEGLSDFLMERFGDRERFTLIRGDCLENKRTLNAPVRTALGELPFRLVANLPYGAATPLIMTLLLDHPTCQSLWVTIQKEVADRLGATPGSRDYGEISVIAQALAEVRPVAVAPPSCFWPRPKVTSAMIGLVRREIARTTDAHRLQALCRELFIHRRKQLGSILKDRMSGKAWPDGVEPTMRPEKLSVEQLEALAAIVAPA